MMLAKKLQSATAAKQYVDDVFSTYLYTGNSSTQTISNGIDLAGEGGLVWTKHRAGTQKHILVDSAQGINQYLSSNLTSSTTTGTDLQSFNSDGFTFKGYPLYEQNESGKPYVSWTFRKAPKFFDVVTFTAVTGDQVIPHSLGVAPGSIFVKNTSGTEAWLVYHRSLGNSAYLRLNTPDAQATASNLWGSSGPDSSSFTLSSSGKTTGQTYVAYLFAHDTGADGLIQCGSYTGNGSATGPIINLGWEPQYVLIKRSDVSEGWYIFDSMRGFTTVGSDDVYLLAQLANEEATGTNVISPLATGFQLTNTGSALNANTGTYIYIAIRRPNKPPTTGTEVYGAVSKNTGSVGYSGLPFSPDLMIAKGRNTGSNSWFLDRLRGQEGLDSAATSAANAGSQWPRLTQSGTDTSCFGPGYTEVNEFFRRAPGFFDVVCYTGTGGSNTISHSLSVIPELVILKARGSDTGQTNGFWPVHTSTGNGFLNDNGSFSASNITNLTASTFGQIQFGSSQYGNTNAVPFVAYLFASLAGISKVGSYTGNGSSQTIDCGFTTGARFVLIKRTDSAGDWYVWDSARGIVSGNDPHLSLNTTAAEVTTDDSVDPDNSGFIVNQVTATNINVNGASYIYLAIS